MQTRFYRIAYDKGRDVLAQFDLVHLILLALLVVFAGRTWGLGITIFDDAQWVLQTRIPGQDPVRDFAVSQGRLWAFPVGKLMAHVLAWQGTLYAEILKAASFAAFVVSFHLMIGAYFNKRVAACTTLLYLALSAIRWESINAYPLLNWPTLTAFALAMLAAHRYYSTQLYAWAALSGILYFYSLFNNEGLSLLLCTLYATLVIGLHLNSGRERPVRVLSLAMIWIGATALYVALAFWWSRIHPSSYNGHEIARFDLARMAAVLVHFSTSGTVLHELFQPYRVIFFDVIQKVQVIRIYDLRTALQDVRVYPGSIAIGVTCALAAALILHRKTTRTPKGIMGLAVLAGLIICCVAILPVTMTSKYQSYIFDSGVQGYQLSNFCSYGISLILASCMLWAVDALGFGRRMMIAGMALVIGALGALTSAQSSQMIADIRPEASRWRILDRAVEVAAANDIDIRHIWAPGFVGGTWYAVLPASYWSTYARYRLGKELSLETDPEKLNTNNSYVKLEYSTSPDRGIVVTLTQPHPGSTDRVVAFDAN